MKRKLNLFALSLVLLVLVLIAVQNPAHTELDLLFWTVRVRHGISIDLALILGSVIGWVAGTLFPFGRWSPQRGASADRGDRLGASSGERT